MTILKGAAFLVLSLFPLNLSAQSPKLRAELKGHSEVVYGVAFTPDGKTLASCGEDRTIRLWDVATGKEKAVLKLPSDSQPPCSLQFRPDGSQIGVGLLGDSVKVWDFSSKKLLSLREKPLGCASTQVAFSPDGKLIARLCSTEPDVIVWEVATGKQTAKLSSDEMTVPMSIGFQEDSKTVVVVENGRIRKWNATTGRLIASKEIPFKGLAASIDSSGKNVAVALWEFDERENDPKVDSRIKLFDAATGKELSLFKENAGPTRKLMFTRDCKVLATVGEAKIKLWDVTSGQALASIPTDEEYIQDVAVNQDGTLVAVTDRRNVKIWEAHRSMK